MVAHLVILGSCLAPSGLGSAGHFDILETTLKLYGRPASALRSLGEPKTSGSDRNKLVRQVPGTHLIYSWSFRQQIGRSSLENALVEVWAAVGDDSGKVEAISVRIQCPPQYAADAERPSISKVAKLLGVGQLKGLFHNSGDGVLALYGNQSKTIAIFGNSTTGPAARSDSVTNFGSGVTTTTEKRSQSFSLSATRVYFVFAGAVDENYWNVFGNSLKSGFRPMPKR